MSEKCDNKKTCGCNDGPIGSPLPCDPCECTGLECAEQFCSECVVSCEQPTIMPIGGSTITILPGDSIYKTLQKFLIEMNAPGCGERCAYSLKKLEITDVSIIVKWFGKDGEDYVLSYWDITTPTTIITVPVVGPGQQLLVNLTSDTTYQIQLHTVDEICYSPIIEIKTN